MVIQFCGFPRKSGVLSVKTAFSSVTMLTIFFLSPASALFKEVEKIPHPFFKEVGKTP